MFENNKIIVALDGLEFDRVLSLIESLKSSVWGFKFNDLLFHPQIAEILSQKELNFFVDAKLHDIPNTVKNAVQRLVTLYNPALLTVHASGGLKMLEQAVQGVKEAGGTTKILAVTVLTSINDDDCQKIFGDTPSSKIDYFAEIAQKAGVFGCICSPHEIGIVKKHGLHAIVPGIRPRWFAQPDDQSRIATPSQAIKSGADALVIGRAITKAENPVHAADKTHQETNLS